MDVRVLQQDRLRRHGLFYRPRVTTERLAHRLPPHLQALGIADSRAEWGNDMTTITMIVMAIGVCISSVAGVVHQSGAAALYGSINWIPHSDWILSNPEYAFGLGVSMVVGGLVCQPRRIS